MSPKALYAPCKGNCGEEYTIKSVHNPLHLCTDCLKKLSEAPYEAPPGFILDHRYKFHISLATDPNRGFNVALRNDNYDVPGAPPALPFKASGELWSVGWDIPVSYVIDADNQCWASGNHGGPYCRTTPENLLSEAEDHEDRVAISLALGLTPPLSAFQMGQADVRSKIVKALTDAGFSEAATIAAQTT